MFDNSVINTNGTRMNTHQIIMRLCSCAFESKLEIAEPATLHLYILNQNNTHWNNRLIIDIRFTENEFTTEHTESTETRKGEREWGRMGISRFANSPRLPISPSPILLLCVLLRNFRGSSSVPHLIGQI